MRRVAASRGIAVALAIGLLVGSIVAESGAAHAGQDGEASRSNGTWLLTSPDQLRPPPPPGNRSATTRAEIRELLVLQEKRTARTRRMVARWNLQPATEPWSDIALDMIVRHRPRPPFAARALALLHTAMYDALVASLDCRTEYDRRPPSELNDRIRTLVRPARSTYPPPQAAVAGAAEKMLTYLFPDEPPRTFARLAREASESRLWAGVNYRSDVETGRALGQRVAELFILRGEDDGSHNTDFAYPRPEGDEYWEPTPPVYESPIGGPVGTWKPWTMEAPDEGRSVSGIPGPLPYGSDEMIAETHEVIDVQANLTQRHREIAHFWDDGPNTFTPAGHWLALGLDLARAADEGTQRVARMSALLSVATHDAAVAFFEAKYKWWSIRPVTVVRRLCDDGTRLCTRAELEADPSRKTYPDWLSLIITPPFPSYPGGHSTFSGAASAVLERFFPSSRRLVRKLAEEAAVSRLYGGIHFPRDNDDGLVLGRVVGQLVLERAPR